MIGPIRAKVKKSVDALESFFTTFCKKGDGVSRSFLVVLALPLEVPHSPGHNVRSNRSTGQFLGR